MAEVAETASGADVAKLVNETKRRLLLGDEALALGALHAGLTGAFSYPGTPATEILEFVERETKGGPPVSEGGVAHAWAANEKVAYEEAMGMSFAGRRALVSFKHVGLNVAADPFMNSAVSGVDGGVVVACADDPGQHSSQNEQDSRVFASFAQVPCLEPAGAQDAYDMARDAFDLSERFGIPVMMRLVTRISHTRSSVVLAEPRPQRPLQPSTDYARWTLLPVNARKGVAALAAKHGDLVAWSETCRWNRLELGPSGGRTGVIASGIAINYFLENFDPTGPGDAVPPYLAIGAYPVPVGLVEKLLDAVDTVLVLEDGYPYIEGMLRGLLDRPRGKTIRGKLDGAVPRTGELSPDLVREALGLPARPHRPAPDVALTGRPPSLCAGCPHIDSNAAIRVVLDTYPEAKLFGDIGCYSLAYLPPFKTIHASIDMGSSISMAMGAAAAGVHPAIASIGDSTFLHSGMTSLVDAAKRDVPMTVMVLDNGTTAMTGFQGSMTTGDDLVRVIRGLGVREEHLHLMTPHRKNHEENVALVKRAVEHRGLSVIVAQRECIQTAKG
ncbi:MAG: indolepyruvate ferredoxin oxidoreductase [Holophagales bacterium]|nr:indolepyruvate ferredoxin oxidoreductase [Holophagales bacterium]